MIDVEFEDMTPEELIELFEKVKKKIREGDPLYPFSGDIADTDNEW